MRALAALLLILVCPVVWAQAYKWKDAQGVTHYSDSPPPDKTAYQPVKLTGGNASATSPTPAAAPAPPPAAAQPSAPPADTPANRKKLCDELRTNTQLLSSGKAITMDDGKGGTRAVDDATRAAELKKAQAQSTLYCSP